MNDTREATIRIGDCLLSEGQSMAVRVAIEAYLILLDDEGFKRKVGHVADGYRALLKQVMGAMIVAGLR